MIFISVSWFGSQEPGIVGNKHSKVSVTDPQHSRDSSLSLWEIEDSILSKCKFSEDVPPGS